jgi:hypothetical protein
MREQSTIRNHHSAVGPTAQPVLCHHEQAAAPRGSAFRRIAQTLVAALREIFDENAYRRFLAHHHMTNTRESYALYLRESNLTRERRPRCC